MLLSCFSEEAAMHRNAQPQTIFAAARYAPRDALSAAEITDNVLALRSAFLKPRKLYAKQVCEWSVL